MTPKASKHLDVTQPTRCHEPIGDLCVLPDATHTHWLVSICRGGGNKEVLRRFESHADATEWAIDERARKMQSPAAGPVTIHFPDDCPCHANDNAAGGSTW